MASMPLTETTLTPEQAAEVLGISTRTVRRLADRDLLQYTREGRSRRYEQDSVMRLRDERRNSQVG
jgi:excisionase family DNA binding protein